MKGKINTAGAILPFMYTMAVDHLQSLDEDM